MQPEGASACRGTLRLSLEGVSRRQRREQSRSRVPSSFPALHHLQGRKLWPGISSLIAHPLHPRSHSRRVTLDGIMGFCTTTRSTSHWTLPHASSSSGTRAALTAWQGARGALQAACCVSLLRATFHSSCCLEPQLFVWSPGWGVLGPVASAVPGQDCGVFPSWCYT